jgi:hypothetical protein
MTTTNKWLLISESHGDLNRCTPCRGKPDQYDTYASHASPRMPGVRFLRTVSICGNLLWAVNRVVQCQCSRQRGSQHNPQYVGWLTHGSIPSFSPKPTNEAVVVKPNINRWHATRLTRPISPVCNQYVQYLLAGANPSIINRHRRGLQPWRCRLSTYHSLTFLTSCLPFPPKGPARSPV